MVEHRRASSIKQHERKGLNHLAKIVARWKMGLGCPSRTENDRETVQFT
jgi:hypothetical protein